MEQAADRERERQTQQLGEIKYQERYQNSLNKVEILKIQVQEKTNQIAFLRSKVESFEGTTSESFKDQLKEQLKSRDNIIEELGIKFKEQDGTIAEMKDVEIERKALFLKVDREKNALERQLLTFDKQALEIKDRDEKLKHVHDVINQQVTRIEQLERSMLTAQRMEQERNGMIEMARIYASKGEYDPTPKRRTEPEATANG